MQDAWNQLAQFESKDLVFEVYKQRHRREPNAARSHDICASFIQAREYFENAARAAITVRPLLQYYGVTALSRGLILLLSASKGAEALKPSHGLETRDWQATFSNGLQAFGDLEVAIRSGTFFELLVATGNRSYLKHNSSGVNWKADFQIPEIGISMSFRDLAGCIPDVASEYKAWLGTPFLSAEVAGTRRNDASKFYEIAISSETHADVINNLFSEVAIHLEIGNQSRNHNVALPLNTPLFFVQQTEGMLGIGHAHLVKPIRRDVCLNTLAVYFAMSYILGMAVRYFPSVWISLGRQEKGDRIFPLVRRLLSLIQGQYPLLVLEFLQSPHPFEFKK